MTRALLAIDGGQTGTRALLADETGRVLRVATGGSADLLRSELAVLVANLDATAFEIAAACIGVTNVDDEESADARGLADAMQRLVPAAHVRVVPDRDAALAAAIDGDGVVVVAGGGAIAAGVGPRGERVVLSGYGYRIGEDGSGVDVGRRAVAAALRGWEDRGPATALTDVVARHFALQEPREIVARIYGPGFRRSQLAALAPAVLEAANAGDAVAAALVDGAAEELASAAAAAALHVYAPGEAPHVALTGGLLGPETRLTRLVAERIRTRIPEAQVAVVPHASAAGAVVLAGRAARLPVDRAWAARACSTVAAQLD